MLTFDDSRTTRAQAAGGNNHVPADINESQKNTVGWLAG